MAAHLGRIRHALRGELHAGSARTARRLWTAVQKAAPEDRKPLFDPLLNLLAGVEPIPSDATERVEIVRLPARPHAPLMIDVYPRFRGLFDMVMSLDGKRVDEDRLSYMNEQFFLDLLAWYHIAWLGHSLKQLPASRHCWNTRLRSTRRRGASCCR